MKRLLSLVLAALLLLSAAGVSAAAVPAAVRGGVTVERIAFQNPDFLRGMDASSATALENAGVRFYNAAGEEDDLFHILAESGVNAVRVRVWNHPFDADGNGYGGGNCDVSTACAIGARAARYGLRLLVDFHYSDFWADPAKQQAPKAWAGMSLDEKASALYDFTLGSLQSIRAAGGDVCMVQIGNETTTGIAGEYDYAKLPRLFNAGAAAVRAFDGNALVALHFTNPEKTDTMKWLADYLDENNVDYDVFATSYYPSWHGTLDNLTAVLGYVAQRYGKYVMVAETSYPYTLDDSDGHPNTVTAWNNLGDNMRWDFTPQGQADAVSDVMRAVNAVPGGKGLGVFYWEGAWITVGDTTALSGAAYDERLAQNKLLWERYGAGWAAAASGEYDPDDAGKWYGGSAVDNQAFFDPSGRAQPSLEVFGDVLTGAYSGEALWGDVNGDGRVDVTDATAIQRISAGLETPDSRAAMLADIDGSGAVNVVDATRLQLWLVTNPSTAMYNESGNYAAAGSRMQTGGKRWA